MAIKGLRETVKKALQKHQHDKSLIVDILQDIQSEIGYLPKDALVETGKQLDVPVSRVYSVATFYKTISLEPRGKFIISVCTGTACHVRGAEKIMDALQEKLNIKVGQTTDDLLFTLQSVRCVGCCATGPVITVNQETHGSLDRSKVLKIIDGYAENAS